MKISTWSDNKLTTWVKNKRGIVTITVDDCDKDNIPEGITYVEDLKIFDHTIGYKYGDITESTDSRGESMTIERGAWKFYSAEKIISANIEEYLSYHPDCIAESRAETLMNCILLNTDNLRGYKKAPKSYITIFVRNPIRALGRNVMYDFIESQKDLEKNDKLYRAVKQANRGCTICANVKEQDKIHTNVSIGDIKSNHPYLLLTRKFPIGKAAHTGAIKELNDNFAYIVRVHAKNVKINNTLYSTLTKKYLVEKCDYKYNEFLLDSNNRAEFIPDLCCWMTDVDFKLFLSIYSADSVEVVDSYRWFKKAIPDELFNLIFKAFMRKESSHDPFAKILLNAIFGVMDSTYINSNYDNWSYLVGTWVCSYARENQMRLIDKYDGFYSAVDSVFTDSDIDVTDWNNRIIKEFETLNIRPVNGKLPGMIEVEHHDKVRVQGVNRYMKDDELCCSGCVVDRFDINEFDKYFSIPRGRVNYRFNKDHTVTKVVTDYSAYDCHDIDFEVNDELLL